MCTFRSDRAYVVCDVAIDRVRAELVAAFGEGLRFSGIRGEGTLIEAGSTVDKQRFIARARAAIAAAQEAPDNGGA